MTITRLKAKNQLTIPQKVVERLHLKDSELFSVEIENNYIKLTPVKTQPRYASGEFEGIIHKK